MPRDQDNLVYISIQIYHLVLMVAQNVREALRKDAAPANKNSKRFRRRDCQIAGLLWVLWTFLAFNFTTNRGAAQVSTTLHSFSVLPFEGMANPEAGLLLWDHTLYGTTSYQSISSSLAFAVDTDGTGFTNLHRLGGTAQYGLNCFSKLVLSHNTLYGTAAYSSPNWGTVFALKTDGTTLTVLHAFTADDSGITPKAGLVLSGDALYGTTSQDAIGGNGGIFKLNTDGSGFTNLYTFTLGQRTNGITYNADGAAPLSSMVASGDILFGATSQGGTGGFGTIFRLNTDGTGFVNLHNFTGGSDGSVPVGELALIGDTLYGATTYGGSSSNGTVFKVNADGTGFLTLHSFASSTLPGGQGEEGYNPQGGLTASGSVLYGTTSLGGIWNGGTVFAINADGTGFTKMYDFDGVHGREPHGELVFSENHLYGTTDNGGDWNFGVVFSLAVLPQLKIGSSGRNLTLSWPTNFAGFDYTSYSLEFTTNLSSATWRLLPIVPQVINGQNTVTTAISEAEQFFRLRVPPSTSVKLLIPQDGAALQAGNLNLLAKASSDPFNSITSVTFLSSTNVLGVVTNMPYSLDWSNVPPGTYFLQAIAESSAGVRATSLVATVTASIFLQNGSFETGNFTGWSMAGTPNPPGTFYNAVTTDSANSHVSHAGTYGAYLGDIQLAQLSQTLWTAPNQQYLLSLWLNNPVGGTNQVFNVQWNALGVTNTLLNLVNSPAFSWTNYQFTVKGYGSDTTILIQAENDPGYFGLDDISLIPVP